MKEYSFIHMTRFADVFGNTERIEYRWEGKSPFCMLGIGELLSTGYDYKINGMEFMYGPFRLRILESYNYETKCVRVDYPFWWVYVAIHRVNRLLDLTYRRIIITASVWRLAEYRAVTVPSYRDLYIVIWIKKLLKGRHKHA